MVVCPVNPGNYSRLYPTCVIYLAFFGYITHQCRFNHIRQTADNGNTPWGVPTPLKQHVIFVVTYHILLWVQLVCEPRCTLTTFYVRLAEQSKHSLTVFHQRRKPPFTVVAIIAAGAEWKKIFVTFRPTLNPTLCAVWNLVCRTFQNYLLPLQVLYLITDGYTVIVYTKT